MANYPLIFTLRELVTGKGYLAGVRIQGKALMVDEGDDGWWAYGVQPGGLAGTGASWPEAYFNFKQTFSGLLNDIAAEVQSFAEFYNEAARCLSTINEADGKAWDAARAAIRAGSQVVQGGIADLPRCVDEVETRLEIQALALEPAPMVANDNLAAAA